MVPQYGYLKIRVLSASGALPIPRARVTVSSLGSPPDDGVLALVYTDSSGNTEKIPVSAPPASLSQSPDSSDSPGSSSSFVNITTDVSGYYSVTNQFVPIFAGVTSVQTVLLVPVAVGAQEYPSSLLSYRESGSPMSGGQA